MPESVQSCFELSIHLSVKRTSRELLLKIVRGKENTGTNVRQNTELHRVLSPMTYPKLVSFRDLTFLYWL